MADSKRSSLIQFALIFLLVYMGANAAMRYFFPNPQGETVQEGGIVMEAADATVKGEHEAEIVIHNRTGGDLVLPDRCPMPPFAVAKVEGDERIPLTAEETVIPCKPLTAIPAGESVHYSLAPWKYSLFKEYGTYELTLTLEGIQEAPTTRFSIDEVGSITRLFRTIVTKPLLNALIFIASLMPGHNLGLAIILLTLIVKVILFFPTQHALEGQRKMQLMQPKIEELRRKHKNDPQRLNQETLKLWKQEKANPFQSCLPMLLQFPVLIGLFYVIRDGSVLDLSRHLLYGPYQDLPWRFGTGFLGLDLTQPSWYVFPPLLVILQFLQMKLSFAIAERKKSAKEKDATQARKEEKKTETESMMQTQQKVMQYGLPIMIGVFAFQFPAAVSLYWGVSTLFAIGQQIVVNREHL